MATTGPENSEELESFLMNNTALSGLENSEAPELNRINDMALPGPEDSEEHNHFLMNTNSDFTEGESVASNEVSDIGLGETMRRGWDPTLWPLRGRVPLINDEFREWTPGSQYRWLVHAYRVSELQHGTLHLDDLLEVMEGDVARWAFTWLMNNVGHLNGYRTGVRFRASFLRSLREPEECGGEGI
jgi:hypothetical protein